VILEREIKFRLAAERDAVAVREAIAGAGFALEPGATLVHEDRYLDTDDWLLYRAGLALRVRTEGTRARLEAKTLRSAAEEEALERTEWAQDAPRAAVGAAVEADPNDPAAAGPPWDSLPEGPVAALLSPLAGLGVLQRLRVVAHVRCERETWRWMRGEEALGSVTVDRVGLGSGAGAGSSPDAGATAHADPGTNGHHAPPVAYREIEIETLNGANEALGAVRRVIEDGLGLSASAETKLEAALRASGARLPERNESAFALSPADRLVDVVYKTLGRHFTRLLWHEPGTRLGVDPDYVHDMRVASRRLRTALEVFAGEIPDEARDALAENLRWVGRALGRVRDTDVLLLRVGAMRVEAPALERPALDVFARSLEIARARARARLLERLDSERYAALIAAARGWIAAGPPQAAMGSTAGTPAYFASRKLIAEQVRALREAYETAERTLEPADLHATRIAAKKARYTVEYFAGLEGEAAARRAKRFARFQDFLGERQDAVTLLERMRDYARTIPPDDRALALASGSVLGHLERMTRTRRGELHRAWEELGEG
jgi:CHAD domain-containing protein